MRARFLLVLTVICALLITWTGSLYSQHIFRMIPLYVSLVIGLLQSGASRFAPLLGSINSLLYAAVYLGFGLYASAASSLLVSFPFQLVTFIRWSRNAYKHSTKFRRLSARQWILLSGAFAVAFVVVNFLLEAAGSSYRFWDNSSTLLGLVISILTVFAFREYTWLMLVAGVLTIGLYIAMMGDDPAQITYLIYAVQSFVCIVEQFFTVRKLHREQEAAA